jgi:hypothetical protein
MVSLYVHCLYRLNWQDFFLSIKHFSSYIRKLNNKTLTGTLLLPLTEVFFPCFSSVVRKMPGYTSQRRSTVRNLPTFNCVVLCIVFNYVVPCIVFVDCVFLCILSCQCAPYYCHRVSTQLQLNISYHISYHTSYRISYIIYIITYHIYHIIYHTSYRISYTLYHISYYISYISYHIISCIISYITSYIISKPPSLDVCLYGDAPVFVSF